MQALYPQESHTKYFKQWFFTTDKNRSASVSVWGGNQVLVCVRELIDSYDLALKVFEGVAPKQADQLEWNDIIEIVKPVDVEAEIASILADPTRNPMEKK